MCFGKAKLTAPKKMSAEETKKLNSRSGDDASVNSMNKNYRDQARGVTKSAPKSNASPQTRSGSKARGSLLGNLLGGGGK